jgi:mannose-1-phosphate guanylyltransferase
MKAILLAAGRGTRLAPWTDSLPKCMVPVAGKPTLQRLVEWLRDEGVTELGINLHHLPDAVTGQLGDGSALGVSIRYSRENELRGTAGALLPFAEWLAGGPFLVVYADNVIACDLAALRALHEAEHAAVTIALHRREDVSASGAATLAGDRIVSFVEKPATGGPGWVSAGLLLCEPRVLDLVPAVGPSDLGADVLPALVVAGETLAGYRLGGAEYLYWIDTPADLERADALLRAREEAA